MVARVRRRTRARRCKRKGGRRTAQQARFAMLARKYGGRIPKGTKL